MFSRSFGPSHPHMFRGLELGTLLLAVGKRLSVQSLAKSAYTETKAENVAMILLEGVMKGAVGTVTEGIFP